MHPRTPKHAQAQAHAHTQFYSHLRARAPTHAHINAYANAHKHTPAGRHAPPAGTHAQRTAHVVKETRAGKGMASYAASRSDNNHGILNPAREIELAKLLCTRSPSRTEFD